MGGDEIVLWFSLIVVSAVIIWAVSMIRFYNRTDHR